MHVCLSISTPRPGAAAARRRARRRGFTLVEVIVAAVIAAFVVGAIWMSLGQMVDARARSRERLHAYVRADAALSALRRDVASVLRSEDLFWTLFRVQDGVWTHHGRMYPRDEMLLFSNRFQLTRPVYDQGEGIEYETQYRLTQDLDGTVLWQRRDSVPDEYFDAGGVVTPVINGIAGLNIEAYNGVEWLTYWDSDQQGLPLSVRITVYVPINDNPHMAPIVLRTEVALDRVPPPFDAGEEEEEEEGEEGEGGIGGGTPQGGAPR